MRIRSVRAARSSAIAPALNRRAVLLASMAIVAASSASAQIAPAPPAAPSVQPPADKPEGEFGVAREMLARPVLRLRGQSVWDEGFGSLRKAILILREEAKRLAIAVEEPVFAHFIDSDELGFTFEAMLPLAAPVTGTPVFAQGVEIAQSPAGKAMAFAHDGTYDELDNAYEAITAWLDEKGLQATGRFIEEYLAIPEKPDDPGLRMNIIVFLK